MGRGLGPQGRGHQVAVSPQEPVQRAADAHGREAQRCRPQQVPRRSAGPAQHAGAPPEPPGGRELYPARGLRGPWGWGASAGGPRARPTEPGAGGGVGWEPLPPGPSAGKAGSQQMAPAWRWGVCRCAGAANALSVLGGGPQHGSPAVRAQARWAQARAAAQCWLCCRASSMARGPACSLRSGRGRAESPPQRPCPQAGPPPRLAGAGRGSAPLRARLAAFNRVRLSCDGVPGDGPALPSSTGGCWWLSEAGGPLPADQTRTWGPSWALGGLTCLCPEPRGVGSPRGPPSGPGRPVQKRADPKRPLPGTRLRPALGHGGSPSPYAPPRPPARVGPRVGAARHLLNVAPRHGVPGGPDRGARQGPSGQGQRPGGGHDLLLMCGHPGTRRAGLGTAPGGFLQKFPEPHSTPPGQEPAHGRQGFLVWRGDASGSRGPGTRPPCPDLLTLRSGPQAPDVDSLAGATWSSWLRFSSTPRHPRESTLGRRSPSRGACSGRWPRAAGPGQPPQHLSRSRPCLRSRQLSLRRATHACAPGSAGQSRLHARPVWARLRRGTPGNVGWGGLRCAFRGSSAPGWGAPGTELGPARAAGPVSEARRWRLLGLHAAPHLHVPTLDLGRTPATRGGLGRPHRAVCPLPAGDGDGRAGGSRADFWVQTSRSARGLCAPVRVVPPRAAALTQACCLDSLLIYLGPWGVSVTSKVAVKKSSLRMSPRWPGPCLSLASLDPRSTI